MSPFAVQAASPVQAEQRTDDEQVVQASLLTFFEGGSKGLASWDKGDFVVVGPKWSVKRRDDFGQAFDAHALGFSWGEHKNEIECIRQITRDGPTPVEDDPQPLPGLRLDARIVVGEVSPESLGADVRYVRNREDTLGTVRVSGRLRPPAYSGNRDYAILGLDFPSRPIGTGICGYFSIYFLLQWRDGHWLVRFVDVNGSN